ncbi:MAG: isoleucine--tRNA ligase [archaeon]|nr:isoleucine--tRNA ligase [archaeon]
MIKQVRDNYAAPVIEKEVQKYWDSVDAYRKTKKLHENGENFYFVDGPPYTSGHVHMGTALNKTIKDIFLRYWRMNGFNVRDQPGFDMHGLPIEIQVEKMIRVPGRVNKDGKPDEVGVRSRKEIENKIGVGSFISACKQRAVTLQGEMTREFKERGVWMDWENPYQTIKNEYIESAWWTVQEAHKKGMLDLSSRVVTWCPRCETALAEAEVEYWDETDPSIVVRFPLANDSETSLLIWTTTPWTLPANMAVAAHPDEDYVRVVLGDGEKSEKVICMESQIEYVKNKGQFTEFNILERINGKDLVGVAYIPPFDIDEKYLKRSEYVFKIVNADYVEASNTGLVHIAPGFGPDDYDTGKMYNMDPFCPVEESGRYTEEFPMMSGRKIKTANNDVIEYLVEKGLLFNSGKAKHRCGHCWRCKTPVIYRNTKQWFLSIPKVKQKMLDEVDRVKWVPSWAGSTREKNWVGNARDWCISRQRYWGIPLPIWECSCGEKKIIGQISDLKDCDGYFDGMDVHRPWIDDVKFKCPMCGGVMNRVPDILDVWFDSGIAAWASLGYPARKEEFDKWWPCKFIVEAHDQTRGWFYSQLGAGVSSFDRAPYDEVMMHAWVLDTKGQKMSKSLGNVVEPREVISEFGADSMRFHLVRANAPWEDMCFQWDLRKNPPLKDGPKNAWKVLNTLWNVVKFASMYMEIDKFDPESTTLSIMKDCLRYEDKWILSRTEKMKSDVEEGIKSRNLHKSARAIEDYIVEDLSKWYVKIVRGRSWTEDVDLQTDKLASYCTLYYVIMQTALVMSPFTPYIAEEIYQHMGGKLDTIHMEDWPVRNESYISEDIEYGMSVIRELAEIIASERAKVGSKLRWPLKQIYVIGKDKGSIDAIKMFEGVLRQQCNVKKIVYTIAENVPVEKTMCVYSGGQIAIDFDITPDVEAEGHAREIIRRIQQMRKDMKFDVEQFVDVEISADENIVEACRTLMEFICKEVRAKDIKFPCEVGDDAMSWSIAGRTIRILIRAS